MAPSGKVQKIHRRIGNARRDHLHKISTTISILDPFALGPFGRKNHAIVCWGFKGAENVLRAGHARLACALGPFGEVSGACRLLPKGPSAEGPSEQQEPTALHRRRPPGKRLSTSLMLLECRRNRLPSSRRGCHFINKAFEELASQAWH